MKRRILLGAAALAVAAAPLLAGPALAQAQADPKKTIKAVMHAPLRITDPIITTAYIIRNHGYMIYDTLFAMDANQKIQPQMVGKVETSADGLTWTFTLRDGLKWHDGQPVTSDDVIASIARWSKNDTMGQTLAAATKEWKKIDDKTFQLVLSQPYGLVLDALGKPSSNTPFIMPKRVAESPPNKAIAEHAPNDWHIGSGPFKFVRAEFQPGTKVVYEKNADYVPRSEPASWLAGGKVVKVDRVEWINVGDPQTTINALVKGEIDFIEQPVHDLFPALKRSPDVVIHDLNKLGLGAWLRMNWLAPPFNNPKIRQAVLTAVQQEDYLAVLVGDPEYYRYCVSFFPCGTTFESNAGGPDMKKPNLEKAKQLLKEGGYKGEKIVILHPTDLKALTPFGPVTEQVLKRIGMNVDLQAMDWASVVARRAKMDPPEQGGWHIFHTFWVGADLLNPINNAGMNAKGKNGGFFGWAEDPEIERMKGEFLKATDPAKQKELAVAITRRAFEVVMYVPLGQMQFPAAYRKSLSGVLEGPVPVFWNIEKK
jgi:peptide/nickel transport system substrate-binding protein